jgi:hypothetical protein
MMARGWGSKSIEAQQDEAARARTVRRPLTEQQRADAERRQTLELSRARASDDLQKATSPHHRRMLEQALLAIDEQLAKLG